MPTGTIPTPVLDEYAETTIRLKVNALIGRHGYTEDDRDDLTQDLHLNLFERLQTFTPTKVRRTTFIVRAVDHRINDLIRAKYRPCRDARRQACLTDEEDRPTNDLDSLPVGRSEDDQNALDLRLDLAPVLDRLSDRQRQICVMLVDHSREAIKRTLGLGRWVFDGEMRAIRSAFEEAELQTYITC